MKGRCVMEKYAIDEMIKKVCAIKAKNNMERVEGLHDEVYAQIEKDSKNTHILGKSAREKI